MYLFVKIVWFCRNIKSANDIIAEARLKSTLRYLNFENYQVGRVHELWSSAKCNQHSVYKSFVHVKISVGTYIFQSNKARFNQFQV